MPNNISGFTGTEIVDRVVSYVGNTRADFRTYVEQTLPLAEFRYCKMHDWSFLNKQNLSLSIVNGTAQYELSESNIGYYMAASDVRTIFDATTGLVLKKTELKDIRRADPEKDDGSSTEDPTHWAAIEDNKILIYPPSVEARTLYLDGKITPGALSTLSNFPTIPYRYQEGFIEYVIAKCLDKENDDRAVAKKQEAVQLIAQDIQDDTENKGGTDLPRIRSYEEQMYDGEGQVNSLLGRIYQYY